MFHFKQNGIFFDGATIQTKGEICLQPKEKLFFFFQINADTCGRALSYKKITQCMKYHACKR